MFQNCLENNRINCNRAKHKVLKLENKYQKHGYQMETPGLIMVFVGGKKSWNSNCLQMEHAF